MGEIERLKPHVTALSAEAGLPVLLLTIPTLRLLSMAQYQNFKQNLEKIVNTDGIVDLMEFARQKLLAKDLDARFAKAGSRAIQYYAWQPLLGDAAIVLSALAYAGQTTPEEASKAFAVGWDQLRAAHEGVILSQPEASVQELDTALNRLVLASPFIKKSLLNACAFAVAADEKICPPEAELLRVIAEVLDCPLPPFIEGV
jgi:hypothetical protein